MPIKQEATAADAARNKIKRNRAPNKVYNDDPSSGVFFWHSTP